MTYESIQLARSPVAYWRLGEASGSAVDLSGNSNTITWSVDPTYSEVGAIDGDADTAVSFAGSSYGTFPNDASMNPAAISVACWVKRTASPGAGIYEGIIDRLTGSDGYSLMFFEGKGQFLVNGGYGVASGDFPSDSEWHYLVGRFSTADGVSIYVDGVEIGTDTYSTAISYSGVRNQVGRIDTGNYLDNITVDELVVFDRLLTPAEMLADYALGSPEEEEGGELIFSLGLLDVIPAGMLGIGVPALQIEPNTVDVTSIPERILGFQTPAIAFDYPVVTREESYSLDEDYLVHLILNRADGYSVTETFSAVMLLQMFDSFGFESARSAIAEFQASVGDSFSFDDFVQGVLQLGVSDAFAFAENSSVHAFLVSIADTFGFSESFVSRIEIALARSDSSGWSEEYIAALQMGRSEQFALAEALVYSFTLLESVSDSFAFTETRADQLYLAFSRSEDVGWGESLSAQVQALVGRADSFGMMGVFSFVGGEKYMAWVVHPKTKAPYKFRNYPFTGFATTAGRVLACADDGIYQLTGDQDAGAAITGTFLRTGKMTFGTELTKRLEEAYLAYSSTGETLLKMIFSKEGEQIESWYKLGLRTRNTPGQAELPIHRGIESVYYQFELALMDGKPTRIEQFTLLPMVTTRMI